MFPRSKVTVRRGEGSSNDGCIRSRQVQEGDRVAGGLRGAGDGIGSGPVPHSHSARRRNASLPIHNREE